jgi:hypothetical protein
MFGGVNIIPIFVLSKHTNDMNTQQINTANFYEGSYQYNTIETPLNITADFIQMKLAKQYEYRPTDEDLWAEVVVNGVRSRYQLDYDNFSLTKIF